MKIVPWVLIVGIIALGSSCSDKDKNGKVLDTATAGSIKIAVDESLRPLLDSQVNVFESIYINAHLTVSYTSEAEAIDLLLKDSVRLIVITRFLEQQELHVLDTQVIKPDYEVIAYEGVAAILHPSNPDSVLYVDQLKKILTGEITSWNQMQKNVPAGKLEVVFDQPTSGILRYLQDTLAIDKLAPHCFAVKDNPSVIDYVSTHPAAIGLIGVSWISDHEDPAANRFLKNIKIAAFYNDSASYQPYQAYIAQKHYPLTRNVIIISREARMGLGSGFKAFVAGDKGQRIVLKAGLVPAAMPLRIVEINHEPY